MMKNTFGACLTLTLFGESHGAQIGCVLDGLAPGIPVEPDAIRAKLALRRPYGAISTGRVEPDEFTVASGVWQGRTTGTPLCILIPNTQAHSQDYVNLSGVARPSHADYTGYMKYHGYNDPRGGGHCSGRLTAPLVAAGAILLGALEKKGILIGTHIARLGSLADRDLRPLPEDLQAANSLPFAVLDPEKRDRMQQLILDTRARNDSLGGVLETMVLGLPAGLGEPWFDTLEGLLAHALFSIPGVKGVEFGAGFAIAAMAGREANDPLRLQEGRIVTPTNHSGGINGGISNGMPLVFRCAVKPTPSIGLPQDTVDYVNQKETTVQIQGRHDPAIVHRARVVADSLTALVLADLLCGRYGVDWLAQADGSPSPLL